MLVTKTIPTLINGVSQQPDSLRLPTQAESQLNLYSSVVEGLKDRPPMQHIGRLYTGTIGDAYAHVINRDAAERYMVLIRNGDLTVHDLNGTAKTVNFPFGKTYLGTTTPSTSIKCLTVNDYTFVLNTEKIPALNAAVTSTRAKEGLIFVKAGNYSTNYIVKIDGTQRAIKTTSDTSISDIRTDAIASNLAGQLSAWAGANYTITTKGSVIHISKVTGDFKLTVEDSQGGSSLACFKDATQSFTSLPTIAPTGFQIQIVGTAESEYDNYHIKFVASQSGETFGEGSWEECVGMGTQYSIDPENMPHSLVREVDGTFTFQQISWDYLTVGDLDTVSQPTFIGNAINDVFFFKKRLGFLSADAVCMSGIGTYFNFWRTTMTSVLDDDPIDYQVSHVKVPILKHAIPFDERFVIFSDQTQFIAQGTPTVTSKTLSVDPTTEFENLPKCRPVGAGKNVYFGFPRDSYVGMREYFVDNSTAVKDATDISAQVPKYIPAGAHRLISSTTENILAVLTSGSPADVYMYKYFYAGDEKLQSAWSKHTLGGEGTIIIGGDFIESTLYLAIQRVDGVYLEKATYAPGVTDPDVNFVTHLDRRITEAQCVSVVYNSGTNTTTWTLPYQIDGTMRIITRTTSPGSTLVISQPSPSTLSATGDKTLTTVYIGQTYSRQYQFSKFFYREEGKNGSTIITAGRLQIRTCTLTYSDTGTFTVSVAQDYRDPSSYVQVRDLNDAAFTGRVLGAGSNLLGAIALASGEFRFPVWAENLKVTITVSSDSFLPMHLQSAEWEGFYHARSRRI
jgi:hypothetical protein